VTKRSESHGAVEESLTAERIAPKPRIDSMKNPRKSAFVRGKEVISPQN
jgi:hypothetical protein